jgi:hypothetical protein
MYSVWASGCSNREWASDWLTDGHW